MPTQPMATNQRKAQAETLPAGGRARARATDIALSRLRLRDLALFVATHEHRSLTMAASSLGFTQPGASRALRDVEQLLRVHLFERDRVRGMTLTPAGERLLPRVRALLADYDSLAGEVNAYRTGTGGHLRLGIIPFVSGPIVGGVLAALTGSSMRMSVSVIEAPTTRLVEELRLERLDAVIGRCHGGPLPVGVVQEPLLRQEGCLLLHPRNPLVRRERVTLADLAPYSWILPQRDTPTRTAINAVFEKAGLRAPVATLEAASTKIIHLAVRANADLLSVVPSDAGVDIERLGGVRRLPFPAPLAMPTVGLIYATRHRDTPVVRNLRDLLHDLMRRREAAH